VHGIIPEGTFKPDYHNMVQSTAEDLDGISRHRYIIEVHNTWVKEHEAKRKA
jgi:hypothetical protein